MRTLLILLGLLAPASFGAEIDIAAIRALSPDEAALAKPVTVRGHVTYYDGRDYNSLFLQDESASIYVELPPGLQSRPGDFVELDALTGSGSFAPNLICKDLRRLESRGLPVARPANFAELNTGSLDCQFVEITGSKSAPALPANFTTRSNRSSSALPCSLMPPRRASTKSLRSPANFSTSRGR